MAKKSQVSATQVQGPRTYQEDRLFYKVFKSKKCHGFLMAVMDGHGGFLVSELCANNVNKMFELTDPNNSEIALANLISGLSDLTSGYDVGSTISSACIVEERNIVSVAILGDSPVFILDKNGKFFISPEHNVRSNAKEREAVLARGGFINRGYVFKKGGVHGIQMSRSLGDKFLEGVISREPEIYTVQDPMWVLVASDGVLDPSHLNNAEEVLEIEKLARENKSSEDVMAWAASRRLQDNATALVWRKNNKQ